MAEDYLIAVREQGYDMICLSLALQVRECPERPMDRTCFAPVFLKLKPSAEQA
jgi:hypothetical protein